MVELPPSLYGGTSMIKYIVTSQVAPRQQFFNVSDLEKYIIFLINDKNAKPQSINITVEKRRYANFGRIEDGTAT